MKNISPGTVAKWLLVATLAVVCMSICNGFIKEFDDAGFLQTGIYYVVNL